MSAQSVRIPVELELKNIQGAISSLKSALSGVSKNSGLYSDLSKEIDKVEKKFLTLQATASRPFFKTSEISSFGNQFLKLGDNINSISERFKNINFKDLDLSKIAGAQEKFNELQKKVEETSGKVQNFMNSEFQKASSSGGELFDVIQKMETAFKGQNLKLDTNSFENSCNIINSKMQEIIRKKEQLDQKLNEQQNKQQNSLSKYESFKDVKKDIESFKSLTDVNNFIAKYDEKAKTLNKGMTGEEYLKAYFGIDLAEIKKAGADLETEKNKILTSKNFVSQSNAATKDFLKSTDLVESTQYQIDEFQRLIGVLQQVGTAFNTFQNDTNRQTAFQKSQEEAEKARIAFDNYKLTILESSGVLGNASEATLSFSSTLGGLQNKIGQAEAKLRALNEQSRKMDQMKSRIAMWFGFTRVMNTVRRTITNAVNEIRELDKVMTEISVVTKMSQEDLWGQIKAYSEIANQYGVSTRGVYEVSQLYYQQGLQTAEVMQLTTETLKMAKIASLDYATATDYMTVAIRGFKMEMEDAQVVTDVYSALAAGTASSTEELAVAMSKTASSAEAVGSSFESTSAMIATMIATTREAPENIGSAMKSIISRYGEMTSDPTKLVDSEGEEMSLNRVDKALRSVGITLQDVNGEFRDFDDVILELAKSWDTIDTNTQRYIATVMAGNRQQSRFLALVGNYEEYSRALGIAESAEDTGTLQALKTMDSLETKIQGVKTAWEQFYNSMGIEKMFKGVLGTVTKIINNLSKMSKPAAFGTIINLFKGIKTLITGISSGISGTFQKLQGNAQNTIGNLKSQLSTLQEVQNINLGDENAHAKLNALIQKLRSLGANIPLSVSTNKLGVPAVTTGGNPVPNSSSAAANQTYKGAYAGMFAYMQANPQAYDNLLNGTKDKNGNSVTSHGMIGEWLVKEGYVSNKKEGRNYSNNFYNELIKGKNFKNTEQALKVFGDTVEKSGQQAQQSSEDNQESTTAITKDYSKVSGYLNVFGGMIQTAGAALTAWALTLEDKSTDENEKSKIASGAGNLVSAVGGGLTSGGSAMMMTGNWVVALIAAVVGALPGLVSGISQLVDGYNYETEERLAAAKKEAEASKNDSIKAKGEANNLQKSITNLKDLEKAQYDSTEAAQAYKDAMNTMADEYPNLISHYDSAGNAIIDVAAAEEALTQARYDAAVAARQAQRDEVEVRRKSIENYKEAKDVGQNFNTYGEVDSEKVVAAREALLKDPTYGTLIANRKILNGDSDFESAVASNFSLTESMVLQFPSLTPKAIMEYAATGIIPEGFSEQQMMDALLSTPAGRGFFGTAVTDFDSGHNKEYSLEELANLSNIEEGTLGEHAGENFKKIVDRISEKTEIDTFTLTGLDKDFTGWENLTDSEIVEIAGKMVSQIDGLITEGEYILNTANESLAAIDFTSTATKEALTHDTEKIEENIGMISSLGGRMMEIWAEEEKNGQDIDALINSDSTAYSEQKEAALEEILDSNVEAVSEIYDNVGQYSSIENYKDAIIDSGIELDSYLGKALVEHFTDTVEEDKDRVQKGIRKSSLKGSQSWVNLSQLFGGTDLGGELLVSYGDSVMEAVNLIDEYTEKGLQAKASVLTGAVEGLYTSIGQQDDSVQADLLSIVEDVDWTSASSIESAIDAMEAYDKQNTEVDLSSEISALQDARDNLSFNLATEVQLMTKAIMEGIEGMEKTISSQNKGMGLNDALEAFKTISVQDGFKDMSFDELFTYDATLKQWVYTQKGFGAAIENQTREIENSRNSAEKAYEEIMGFSNPYVRYSEELDKYVGQDSGLNDIIENIEKIDQDFNWSSFYGGIFENDTFAQQQIIDYKKSGSELTFTEWLAEQVNLGQLEKEQMEAIYAAWGDNIINLLSSGLDIEAIMSGTDAGNQKSIMTQIIAQKLQDAGHGEEYIKEHAEKWAESALSAIQEGNLYLLEQWVGAENITHEMRAATVTTPAENVRNAISELLSSNGTVLSETSQKLLEQKGLTNGLVSKNGVYLVGEASEMQTIIDNLLSEVGGSLEEINSTLADVFKSVMGVNISSASEAIVSDMTDISIDELEAWSTATGQELPRTIEGMKNFFSDILEWDVNTQSFKVIEGVSFEEFFARFGQNLSQATDDYLDWYSSNVEKILDNEINRGEKAVDELESLSELTSGEKTGVVYLQNVLSKVLGSDGAVASLFAQYGVNIENGIATIGENADIYHLINTITQLDGIGDSEISNSIIELKDSIIELFDSWVEALSSGLSGELSNADAEALKQQFSFLSDMDFTETKNGLKLSRDAAFELYTELKKIDSVRAGLAFDSIVESLTEAGSGYEDVASTMKTIAKLNKELANVPVSSERRKELELELAVAEEILRVRSQDPDSFNFMDKDLPTGMQGPENYWNSVGEAYKVMNESAKSGYMEIQDYVNIVNQMEAMAIAAGQEFSIGGMNAAQLIEKGMSSLKNIDGEGVKIAMEGVGIDFANAATDMGLSFDDGIKEVAKSQIKMLDAAIRVLEAMVALEELDIDGSGMLEMDEIFTDGDPGQGFTRGAQEWLRKINLACGDLKIGGKTLEETMLTLAKTDPDKFLDFINQMTNIDWTLGDTNVAAQIEGLINTFFPGEVVSMGKSIFDILEIPEDVEETPEKLAKWAESVGLAVGEARALLNNLEYGSTISQGSNQYEAIKKSLGLDKNDQLSKDFDNFYKTTTEKGFNTREAIQLWDEVTVSDGTEGTKYTYNGITYDTLDDVLVAKQLKETEGISGKISNTTTDTTTGEITSELSLGQTTITVTQSESGTIYRSADGVCESTDLRKVIDYEVYQKTKETPGMSRVEAYAEFGIDLTAEGLANVSVKGIKETLSAPELQKEVNKQTGEITVTIDGKNITFAAGTTDEQIRQKLMEAIGIDTAQMETIVAAISTAISTADWSPVGKAISEALTGKVETEEGVAEGIEIGELTLKPTALKIDTTGIQPTLGDNLAGTAEAPIGIGDIGVVSGTASELKITSIPPEGTYSPEGEGSAGKITITGGIPNAEGEVTTITLTPVAGATSSVSGNIPAAEVAAVTINGTTYTVDVSQGAQINTTMDLTGVKAGSATVEATSYTVTFTNANGTTETVIVQGKAQLDAVLTGAKQEGGIWKIPNVTGEADITISDPSKSALETFFDTLVDKLKNIEIGYKEPTLEGPENPVTSENGGYQVWTTNREGQTYVAGNKTYSNEKEAGYAAQSMIKNGQTETEVVQVNAEGARIDVPKVEIPEGKTETGPTKEPKETKVETPTPQKAPEQESLALDLAPIQEALTDLTLPIANAATLVNNLGTYIGDIPDNSLPITNLSTAISSLTDKSQAVQNTANAINNLQSKTITASVGVTVKVDKPAGATGNISISNGSGSGFTTGSSLSMNTNLAKAKGNVALATGKTLMGELGPELVVSGGRYFVVGQGGAEFVDLADDAIVFNHLQTKKLLGSGSAGHGKPVTNERKATSLATGNAGPAMASASAALAQLRQIRAMWQSMLNASAKDLGSKAGSGGDGGGGGGGGGEDIKAVTGELERWYNLLRQIDSLEQHITLEQAKRANMTSGYDYVDSLERELDMLKKQQKAYQSLSGLQKDYYDRRREDLLSTDYSKIFTYDEHGLMQYVDGENRGLDVLAKLNERDASGKLINNAKNAKTQINYLKSIGFDTSQLLYNEDGTKLKKNDYEGMMENFWGGIDGWMEEMDGLYDSYHEAAINSEEATEKMNEILQEYIDNQLEVEQKIMQAIQDREQAEIDRIQDEKDTLEKAAQAYIDGLSEALSKEQDMYSKNETKAETQKLQRQLAILQRSGGSTSEIKSLQEQIDSRLKDAYFQEQQDQIDAIQKASDAQLEKLQTQIDLMTETLEYQKENGLLWQEVYEIMNQWTPEQIVQFIEQYTKSYQENSTLQNEEDTKETQKQVEMYKHDAELKAEKEKEGNNGEKEESPFEKFIKKHIENIGPEAGVSEKGFKDTNLEEKQNAFNSAQEAYDKAQADYDKAVYEKGKNSKAAKSAKKELDKKKKALDTAKTNLDTANKQTAFNEKQNAVAKKAEIIKGNEEEIEAIYNKAYEEAQGSTADKELIAQAAANDYMSSLEAQVVSTKAAQYYSDKKTKKPASWQKSNGKKTTGKLPEGTAVTITGVDRNENPTKIRGEFTDPSGTLRTGYFKTSSIQNWNAGIIDNLKKLHETGYIPVFKQGGLVDFTGPAWVDGTKAKPEAFLSASDTAMLKSKIFSNSDGSLKSLVAALERITGDTSHYSAETNNEQIIIQNAQVNIQPGTISNDYDARRAGEMALEEMVKIARKTTNRVVSR